MTITALPTQDAVKLRLSSLFLDQGEIVTNCHYAGTTSDLISVYAVENGRIIRVNDLVAETLNLSLTAQGVLRVTRDATGTHGVRKPGSWATPWLVEQLNFVLFGTGDALARRAL